MNTNLLIIGLLIYSTVTLLIVLFSYNLGLRNGQELSKQEKVTEVSESLPASDNNYQTSETETERLIRLSWDNISNYDGTDIGQREVK